MPEAAHSTGIWDNYRRGKIGEYLRARIRQGADLSFVSAYFTIYVYDALKIFSIAQTMQTAQTHFTRWADPERTKERKVARLMEALDSSFFSLLDELTIARSRRHIENYYDISRIGKFPERLKPVSLAPDIDTKGFFPTYDELNDQKTRETYLIGMMRMNFLKRLESSIESFEITIDRTINKIETRSSRS